MTDHRRFTTNGGLTLIEMLLVLAVAGILTGMVGFGFSQLNAEHALDKGADTLISLLHEARTLTLSSADASRYGVNFQADKAVLFKGDAYSASDPENVETNLNSLLGVRNWSFAGGGSSVVFDRLSGGTAQAGTVEVYLKSASTTFKTVRISRTGVAEID